MRRMALCSGGGSGTCCMHLRTPVSRRPLAFSYLWDRMGFWCGQRQLRLIGRSCTQAMFHQSGEVGGPRKWQIAGYHPPPGARGEPRIRAS